MKRSALLRCVVVVSTLLVVLMCQVPCMDAANCNYLELVACAGAITSPQPPSKDCCSKVKQQKPCFCGYLRNPQLRQYVTPEEARRVARQCGVTLPRCS
ncbi:non-specific lipid-transfer protein 2-like protein [Tanacetum coccineum]